MPKLLKEFQGHPAGSEIKVISSGLYIALKNDGYFEEEGQKPIGKAPKAAGRNKASKLIHIKEEE